MDRSKNVFRSGVREALEELSLMLIDEAHASETCWMAETRGLFAMAFIAFSSAASIAGNAVEEPAAVARDYRSVPSRYQHYYPTTGVKP